MDAARDCLDQYRERSMDDTLERTMVDRAVKESNSSRLQALIERFEQAIQPHDIFSPPTPGAERMALNE